MKMKQIAAILAAAAMFGFVALPVAGNAISVQPVSVSAATSTLRRNSKGSAVTKLQKNLITLNFMKSGSASGTYDAATENAVKNFQSEYNLVADGVAGSATQSLISALLNGTAKIIKVESPLVNVRNGAGMDFEKVTTVSSGQKFVFDYEKINKTKNKWYHILMGTKSGYISGEYVSVVSQVSKESDITEASGKIKVIGTVLNVRADATTSSEKLAVLKQGQTFDYSKYKTVSGVTWYYIKVDEKVSGWVMGTFVTSATSTPAAASSTGTLKVVGTVLNVRASASTSAKKVTTVKKGQTYDYTKVKTVKDVNWYYIKVNSKKSGWVMGTFVSFVANGNTTAPSESGTVKVTGTILNVREEASEEGKKLTTVRQGETYTYSEVKKINGINWYHIKVSDTVNGWVMGSFVDFIANGNNASPAANGKLTITGSLLNVRSGASTSSKVVATVKVGQTFSYSKVKTVSKTNWYYIKVSDKVSGWVIGTYVNVEAAASTTTGTSATEAGTTASSETTTTSSSSAKTTTTASAEASSVSQTTNANATPETSGQLTVNTNVLNVRADASSNATILTTVTLGKEYAYDNVKTVDNIKWYRIKVTDTVTGWVMGTYIVVKSEQTPAPSSTSGSLKVTGSVVNVRKGAGTSYDKVAYVKKDEIYSYSQVKDGWYYIKINDKQSGWIIGQYVNATPDTSTTSTAVSPITSATPTETTASPTETTTVPTETTTVPTETTAVPTETPTVPPETTAAPTESKAAATEITLAPAETMTDPTESKAAPTEITTASSETTSAPSETTSAPNETTTTTAAPTRTVTVGTVNTKSSGLNVRSGAGSGYAVIGQVKKGDKVIIVSKGSKWHKIEYGAGIGYVAAEYIKDIRTSTEAIAAQYPSSYYYANVNDTLDLKLTVKGYTVSYKSSDAAKCPISSKGVVLCHGEGLYTITAKYGNYVTTTCVVVLKKPNENIQPLKISAEGTKFIADWEGGGTVLPTGETVYYPYQDVSGFWTIGYGHAKTTTASKSWSEERAIAEFNQDIEEMIGAEFKLTDDRPYLTQEGATKLLNADLNDGDYVKAVSDWAVRNGVQLNQVQFDALCSFCYNIGTALWTSDTYKFYLKSSIIAYRSGSDAVPDQVIEGFCRYMKSSGKSYKGLWYRRRNEAELFLTGDYALDRENKFKLPSGVDWA